VSNLNNNSKPYICALVDRPASLTSTGPVHLPVGGGFCAPGATGGWCARPSVTSSHIQPCLQQAW